MSFSLQNLRSFNDKSAPADKRVYPLSRLVPYLKRYPLMVGLSLLAILLAAVATLLMPMALRLVIDQGLAGKNGAVIDTYFLLLLGIAFLLAMGAALRFYCSYWLGERLVADLKRDVFQRLITLSAAFYDKSHSGELMSHLAADSTVINTALRSHLSQALRNVVVLVGGVVMMLVSSSSLSLMVIAVIPLIVLPLMLFGRAVRRLSSRAQDVLAELHQFGAEMLHNVRAVQAFAAEDKVIADFDETSERSVDMGMSRTRARAVLTAVAIFLVMASIVGILWYGARDVLVGNMSAGTLVQFMLYAVFAGGAMAGLSEVWGEVAQAAGAAERLSSFLDETSEVREAVDAQGLPTPLKGEIVFEGVGFAYPSRPESSVLEGVDLTIKPGERVAIVGASGAGKSTLFHLLLRFYDPHSGVIKLDGMALPALKVRDLRRAFAVVPQEPTLFATSIQDNIAFVRRDASFDEVVAAAKAAQADEFISQFPEGYDTFVGEGGARLSGGQRQRIALARAILSEAPILLLDEATSALDAQSEEKVQKALEQIMAGRTSLVIAHRLSTVKNADRILVMSEGQLVEEGEHNSLLMKGGVYAELARTQFLAD